MSSSTDRRVAVTLDLRLAGYRGGGIARYGNELYTALQAIPDIDVSSLRSRRDDTADAHATRVLTPAHHRREQIALPVELLLRRRPPGVYHAIDFVAPRLPRTSVVATVHDLAFRHWPQDLSPDALRYYRQIERTRRWTDAWITPSAWTARDLAEMYAIDRDRIHVIPHGESLGLLRMPPLPRQSRRAYVLAVGTVEPRKQYDLLMDAMSRVSEDVELVVAGRSGWNSGETERRLKSTVGVTWIADADDDKVRSLYREAIAVVIPSRAEGFGLSALEAMAAGTPVVSSGGGALPEVTGACSLEVTQASADAWAAGIVSVIADTSMWERMSQAGRARATEFEWDTSARATAGMYIALGTN